MTDRTGKKSSIKYTDSNIDPALYIDSLIIVFLQVIFAIIFINFARPMPYG